MRPHPLAVVPLLVVVSPALLAETGGDTHTSLAEALVDLLSQTELCLRSCQTAEHVQAALPTLRELRQKAETLSQRQQKLPEPSQQDYLAAQVYAQDFNTLWKAIQQHISRIQQQGLMTPELRDILSIAPEPSNSHPTP